jgi:serpin B
LDNLTRLVLTNAIYFKGSWHTEFDKKNTKKMPFAVTADESVKAKMMYQKHKFNYTEDETVQVVEMPYAGNEIAMLVVLPKTKDGLSSVEKDLTGEKLAKLIDNLKPTQVELYFPKFELNSSFKLETQLKALGLFDAFDGAAADFSGMADPAEMKDKGNLFISAVIHKAFTKVNEKGTEAAAATAVVVRSYSSAISKIVADHPFMFFIREVNSGAIFFAGRVTNPKAK